MIRIVKYICLIKPYRLLRIPYKKEDWVVKIPTGRLEGPSIRYRAIDFCRLLRQKGESKEKLVVSLPLAKVAGLDSLIEN